MSLELAFAPASSGMARILGRCALAVAFVLLLAGGWVHATGASLACPDWPLCHGTAFPAMVGGVRWEHGHRLIAGGLATLVAALSALLLASRTTPRPQRRAAWMLVGMILLQSVLGGLTVIFKLPPWISISHLALSQLVFATLVWLDGSLQGATPALDENARKAVFHGIFAVYAQEVAGAIVRHLGAGLACGTDFPTCHGAWLPSSTLDVLQLVHRIGAFVVLAFVLRAALAMRGTPASRHGTIAVTLIFLQIALGIASVWFALQPVVVTLHLGGAAALLAVLVHAAFASQAPYRASPEVP